MELLKKLRELTFAPLKDCKDALVEAEGDLDKATGILKEKGILKAGKKADRETNEGSVKVIKEWNWTAWVKLSCETDFVAKNETFQELLDVLLKELILSQVSVESISDLDATLLDTLTKIVSEFVGKIGENVKLEDTFVTDGNVFVYNHPGNKVATVVYYNGDNEEIAKEVALQVAAMNPTYLSRADVAEDFINELKEKFQAELLDSGKPENMIEQIMQGKLNKALSEFILLEQEYIRDGSKKLKDIFPEWFEVTKYVRLTVRD